MLLTGILLAMLLTGTLLDMLLNGLPPTLRGGREAPAAPGACRGALMAGSRIEKFFSTNCLSWSVEDSLPTLGLKCCSNVSR